MTGEEFRTIRKAFGMDRPTFSILLGYTGNETTNERRLQRFETNRMQIPLYIARLAWLLNQLRARRKLLDVLVDDDVIDSRGIALWPDWPGYDFESVPDQQEADDGSDSHR